MEAEDEDLELDGAVGELPDGGFALDPEDVGGEEEDDDSRMGRKRARGRSHTELQRELEEVRAQREEDRRLMQEEMRRSEEFRRQANAFADSFEPPEDPIDSEIESLDSEMEQVQKDWNALSRDGQKEREAEFRKRVANIRRREARAEARRAYREEMSRSQGDPQQQYEGAALRSEFPDLVADQKALQYANGIIMQRVAEGEANSLDLKREALKAAREKFRKDSRASGNGRPNDRQKARYGGVSSSAAGSAPQPSRSPRLSSQERAMAEAFYSDRGLSEAEMYRKYFNEVLSKQKKA